MHELLNTAVDVRYTRLRLVLRFRRVVQTADEHAARANPQQFIRRIVVRILPHCRDERTYTATPPPFVSRVDLSRRYNV